MTTSIAEAESRVTAASRHVRQGERNIVRQRAIVARLAALGYSTIDARKLLETFEKVQLSYQFDLDRLVAARSRLTSVDDDAPSAPDGG